MSGKVSWLVVWAGGRPSTVTRPRLRPTEFPTLAGGAPAAAQAAQKSTSRSGRSQSCVRVPSGWAGPGWSSGEAPVQYGENRRQLAPLLPCYPHPRPGPHTRTPDLCRLHTNTRELGHIPLFLEDSLEGFVCWIPQCPS